MTNDMKEDYKRLLIREYHTLLNWEPDREMTGIQFDPSDTEVAEVIRKIKKIDPNWKTPEELDYEEWDNKVSFLTDSYIEQAFPQFYNPKILKEFDDKTQKFLKQVQRRSLSELSPKQQKWILGLIAKHGAKETAEELYRCL